MMLKRVLDIVTFPFHLLYLIISFPFVIIKLFLTDKKEKSLKNGSFSVNQIELLEFGQLLFPIHKNEFQNFFNSFISDKKRFLTENEELLKNYDNFELDKLKAIEAIYVFGDSKEQLWLTDWRGEENEREIENFLENKLQIKADWTNLNKLKSGVDQEKQRDGKFIIDVLKTVDKDLELMNKRIIFLDLGWDAYVYTVVDQSSFKTISDKFGKLIHGTENLNK